MDAIQFWLKGSRNYQTGVKILLMHTKDPVLTACFAEARSVYKEKRLLEEMEKLAQKHKADTVDKTEQVEDEVYENRWSEKPTKAEDSLKKLWKEKFVRMMDLQSRLEEVAKAGLIDARKKEQACEMAHTIIALDKECDEFYRKRDFIQEHGAPPVEASDWEMPTERDAAWKQYQNAKRYAREYARYLKRVPNDEQKRSLYVKWMARIAAIEAKFNFK